MKITVMNMIYPNKFVNVFFLFVLISFSTRTYANNFETTIAFGVGNYQLSDLRAFQNQLIPAIRVDIKSVVSFPAYYNYQLSMLYYLKGKWGIGAVGSFFSTGGRNHYADYSGFYRLDLLIDSKNAGLVFNRKYNLQSGFYLIPQISSGAKWSKLSIEEEIKVLAEGTISNNNIKSLGWWIEPNLRVSYQPVSFLMVGTSLGYEFNLPSKNYLAENNNLYFVLKNQKNMKIGWSGLRFSVALSFIF